MIYLDEQTDHTQASLAYRHITQTSVYESDAHVSVVISCLSPQSFN